MVLVVGGLLSRPLRTRANRSAAFQESPEMRVPFINKKRERGAKIETLADDLINLNCGTHSLGLIYEFLAKQFGEARGREEFIKYLSGEWSRDWVQAAAARVAEEQPNWLPPIPAPARISNEDGANAGSHLREERLLSNSVFRLDVISDVRREFCVQDCTDALDSILPFGKIILTILNWSRRGANCTLEAILLNIPAARFTAGRFFRALHFDFCRREGALGAATGVGPQCAG